MAPDQLELIDPPARSGRMDARTREIGRRGVAEARAALRRKGPPSPPPQDESAAA